MEERNEIKVPRRILTSLIGSLSAGVVPRVGAPYIAIGRDEEVKALLKDLETVADGGSTMRFIIGKYGSGKSFLIQLIRGNAMDRGFVCADCDLSPERRICGGKGSGIATYRELIKNMATKTSREGGALSGIISKWLSIVQSETAESGILPDSAGFTDAVGTRVYRLARELENSVGGFDFAKIISEYYRAYTADDEEKKSACMRWLRGEYATKSEARRDLNVGTVIDDENWYEYIKLWAEFSRKIGYKGFVVFIDECAYLYKITNRVSRENNYEKILSMFNDTLQGRAPGLSLVLGGTPQFLEDTRRGLFSYEALRSRLSDGRYTGQYRDMMGPVIRLRRLSDNELYALINRVTLLHGMNYGWSPRVNEAQTETFLRECLDRAGADTMITTREIIRDYVSLLNVLYQNPGASFEQVMGRTLTLSHEGADGEEGADSAGQFDIGEIEI